MTRGRRLAVALVAVALLATARPAPAQSTAEDVRATRLDNGLTVIVRERTPVSRTSSTR
jgi:hypothetical protein